MTSAPLLENVSTIFAISIFFHLIHLPMININSPIKSSRHDSSSSHSSSHSSFLSPIHHLLRSPKQSSTNILPYNNINNSINHNHIHSSVHARKYQQSIKLSYMVNTLFIKCAQVILSLINGSVISLEHGGRLRCGTPTIE